MDNKQGIKFKTKVFCNVDNFYKSYEPIGHHLHPHLHPHLHHHLHHHLHPHCALSSFIFSSVLLQSLVYWAKLKTFIIQIVSTILNAYQGDNSYSENRPTVLFAAIWEKLLSKLKKRRTFFYETKMQKLDLRLWCFFYVFFNKLTPQLITFNIPTHDWISFPTLVGTGVFISGIVNPIIKSVNVLFWVSVFRKEA